MNYSSFLPLCSQNPGLQSVLQLEACLHPGPVDEKEEISKACCDQFSDYFAGKINHICAEFYCRFVSQSQDMQGYLTCPVLLDTFCLVHPRRHG